MKLFLISDNVDTLMGMRLSGIEGVIVHEKEDVKNALDTVIRDKSVAVVLITEKLVESCHDIVYDIKLNRKTPLILEIPDRHGTSQISETMARYVQEAVGIKI
ncbi:MAG: V-type ATP synthase subunit F [Oscillospiraceae bacterium]|jgi:V/A-type H+-transporting ATPase subunit F|nr:V-type ATP synthase subunit F [Oscillospiraceae bacterium]